MARGVGGEGPANIMEHIKGVHFPASKDEILKQAEQNAGPDRSQVLGVLRQISDQRYDSPAAILKEVGRVE